MENNTPQNTEASETVGEILRNKREEIGLSLDEITEKLNLDSNLYLPKKLGCLELLILDLCCLLRKDLSHQSKKIKWSILLFLYLILKMEIY